MSAGNLMAALLAKVARPQKVVRLHKLSYLNHIFYKTRVSMLCDTKRVHKYALMYRKIGRRTNLKCFSKRYFLTAQNVDITINR